MNYLLLLSLISCHYSTVNGNFEVGINSQVDDGEASGGLLPEAKLIIDIIESKAQEYYIHYR